MRRRLAPPSAGAFDRSAFPVPTGKTSWWERDTYYELDATEAEVLALAGREVHERCLDAVQHVVTNALYARLQIHPELVPAIEASWKLSDHGASGTLYGRIDLVHDGVSPPKFLEYNAESATSALETDRGQRLWLAARGVDGEPFAELATAMAERWRAIAGPHATEPVVFVRDRDNAIDEAAAAFMQDCAEQAGLPCVPLDLAALEEWLAAAATTAERPWLFKLIRWDLLLQYVLSRPHELIAAARVVEPPWKAILTSKHILTLLHEMFPRHPNLLPAADRRDLVPARLVVRKPARGMAQMNVAVLDGDVVVAQSDGDFGDGEVIFQEYAAPADHDGFHPLFGCWIVGGEARGLGIVEFEGDLFGEHHWVPHVVRG